MRKLKFLAASAVLAVAFGAAGAAQAQIAPGSNAPIDIAADESEVFTQECRTIWRGDVEALQARTRLRTRTLNVYYARNGNECGDTERLVAEGEVYYVSEDRRIRANTATYLAKGETITLTGDVVVVQGQNVARADRVVIDLRTGKSQMVAASRGRASKNRVRAVLYPGSSQN
ncbi:MAG: LptA/OstA family protein [Caulobacter sp.]|jgi:lipopolysaccharide export system protein LptA